jgi:hypothetical protein
LRHAWQVDGVLTQRLLDLWQVDQPKKCLAPLPPDLFLGATAAGLSLTVPIFTYFAHALSQAATGNRSGVYRSRWRWCC